MKFDVCLVGPTTKDIIVTKNKRVEKTGGVVYYSSLTLKKFGLNVCVFTKINPKDKYLIKELEEKGIKIFWKESKETEEFHNIYLEDVDKRVQEVHGAIDKIKYEEIKDIEADWFYFGPLLNTDLDLDIYEKVKKEKKARIVLDIQGHLRKRKNEKIYLEKLEDLNFLKYIDILKLNEEEIEVLTGKKDFIEAGNELKKYCKEIILTLGKEGSIIFYNNSYFKVPVFKPRKIEDPTGCGDIYTATFLAMRIKGFCPESSALFASVVSGFNVEKPGFYIPLEFKF